MTYVKCDGCGSSVFYENVCEHGDKEGCVNCCSHYDCADFYGSNWVGNRCKCGQPLDETGNENYERMCEHDGCSFCCGICKQIGDFEQAESERIEALKAKKFSGVEKEGTGVVYCFCTGLMVRWHGDNRWEAWAEIIPCNYDGKVANKITIQTYGYHELDQVIDYCKEQVDELLPELNGRWFSAAIYHIQDEVMFSSAQDLYWRTTINKKCAEYNWHSLYGNRVVKTKQGYYRDGIFHTDFDYAWAMCANHLDLAVNQSVACGLFVATESSKRAECDICKIEIGGKKS